MGAESRQSLAATIAFALALACTTLGCYPPETPASPEQPPIAKSLEDLEIDEIQKLGAFIDHGARGDERATYALRYAERARELAAKRWKQAVALRQTQSATGSSTGGDFRLLLKQHDGLLKSAAAYLRSAEQTSKRAEVRAALLRILIDDHEEARARLLAQSIVRDDWQDEAVVPAWLFLAESDELSGDIIAAEEAGRLAVETGRRFGKLAAVCERLTAIRGERGVHPSCGTE